MGSRDLRRYDEFGIERPSIQGHTIPRIRAPGGTSDSPLSTLSTVRVPHIPRVALPYAHATPLGRDDGIPPTPPPTQRPLIEQQRGSRASKVVVVQNPMIVDPILNDETLYRLALFRNPALGLQRCAFVLQKFPALVMMFVSAWVLWGRGFEQKRISNEGSASMFSFVTGAFVLASILFGSADHNNSYTRAKIMTNIRHILALVGGLASIAALILSASSIHPLDNEKNAQPTGAPSNVTDPAFDYRDRINNQAVLVGATALVILLSVIALVLGIIGLTQMEKRLKEEKRRRRNVVSYDNPAISY
ncbi:unnamed protein product, partial [Mesorhabditis spiculigera]